jgi:hypothetical protein
MDKQSWILIALELDLPSILKLCKTNKNIKGFVCDNYYFWGNKLKKDYNFTFTGVPNKNRDPRKLYQYIENLKMDEDIQAAEFIKEGNDDLAKFLILTKRKNIFSPYVNVIPSYNESLKAAASKNNVNMIEFLKEHKIKGYDDMFLDSVIRGAILGGQFKLLEEYIKKLISKRGTFLFYFPNLLSAAFYANEYAIPMLDYLFSLLNTIDLHNFIQKENKGQLLIWNIGNIGRLDLLLYLKKKGFNNFSRVLEGANNSDNIKALEVVDYVLKNEKVSSKDKYQAFTYAIEGSESTENPNVSKELVKVYLKHGLDYNKASKKASKMIDN